jgi:hypothetical protein
MKKKATKKTTEKKPYHLVYYVQNCTPAMQKFNSLDDMQTFFKEFEERYPKKGRDDGTFIDFYITDISGEIKFV